MEAYRRLAAQGVLLGASSSITTKANVADDDMAFFSSVSDPVTVSAASCVTTAAQQHKT